VGAECFERQTARLRTLYECGEKGATLQRPGWAGNHIGFEPFPIDGSDVVSGE
jgi:hypothetical protein